MVNASITPGDTLAAGAGFPQCSAGLLNAFAQNAILAALAGFPQCAASGVVNASITPGDILNGVAAVPACLVIAAETGPDYAGSAGILAGGTGTWTDPAAATGPPDQQDASWAVT